MILNRRKLLTGLGATLITAPAIVRVVNLMPVKSYPVIGSITEYYSGIVTQVDILYGTMYVQNKCGSLIEDRQI